MKLRRRANGTGTIIKLNGNRLKPYAVKSPSTYINGIYRSVYIGYASTIKEAQAILDKYNAENIDAQGNDITFSFLFKYCLDKKENTVTYPTLKRYETDTIEIMKPYLEYPIRLIRYIDVQNRLDLFPITKGKTCITMLKEIYMEAIKRDILIKDISALVQPSKIQVRVINRNVYPDEFVQKLWDIRETTNDEYTRIIDMTLILFYTGMRGIEICKLENKNIFLDKNYFIAGSKTEAGQNRIIPIHSKIKPIMSKYISKGILLFPELSGYTSDNLRTRFKKLKLELNIDNDLHSIRHTFITKLQRLNLSVSKIKKIVGHKSKDVTDGIYTHYTPEDLLEIINKLKY